MKNKSSRSDKNQIPGLEAVLERKMGSRDRYLLERDRIKGEIGSLDQIREKLGLSQRRACQLLLVDPSAWTRWNKTEAPPHVYQALKWLLELKKLNPEAAGPSDLHTKIDFVQKATQTKIKELEQNVSMLEKAVSFNPAVQVAPAYTPENESLLTAFAEQEARFANRIKELEAKIQELAEAKVQARAPAKIKTGAPRKARSARKVVRKEGKAKNQAKRKTRRKMKLSQKTKSFVQKGRRPTKKIKTKSKR